MIRNKVVLLVCFFVFTTQSCSWGLGLPVAKITIKVIDENAQPVEGAKVGIGFSRNTGSGTKEIAVTGFSAIDGSFSGSAFALDSVGFRVEKDGYYQSFGEYRFKERETGRWKPWNPEITVVMRKIENPVPMYARDTSMMHPVLEIPVSDKEVGFDLIESDWISPYGKGKHSDIIYKLERNYTNNNSYDGQLTITFPNRFDGIQLVEEDLKSGSLFKLPRYAPEGVFMSKLIRTYSKKGVAQIESSNKEDNNYIFRIRSEEKDGKLLRAMYGKIYGDIGFGIQSHQTASVLFKYFLNPDYTRNLEYSGKNLLSLPDREIQPH